MSTLRNLFIDGPAGRLMAVLHEPAARGGPAVVHVPAFGDEMNKSRRMVALTARALADHGVTVLVVDPFGTGDSEGEFAEARWETWRADVECAVEWLVAEGHGPVHLWGLRTGALLAAEVAARRGDADSRLVLWQPVLSGEQFLMQFLRLLSAGGLVRGSQRPSVKDVRAGLAGGTAVEVGGYLVTPELAAGLAASKLAETAPAPGTAVSWCEVAAGAPSSPSPAANAVLEAWRGQGVLVEHASVPGDPFWSSQNISLAPALIERSVTALEAA